MEDSLTNISSLDIDGITKQQDENQAVRLQYSMPGILHYLQTEWARFVTERAQWDVERAELQARVAFLQGERKGQENLKQDLVRRIKMLEFALKQERAKYHKLKYGTDLNQGDAKLNEEKENFPLPIDGDMTDHGTNNVGWKQGRHLLRQYLQEIGYADTIIDVRSARVRHMLGLQPITNNSFHESKAALNGDEANGDGWLNKGQDRRLTSKKPLNGSIVKMAPFTANNNMMMGSKASVVMATLDFLSDAHVVDDDDDNLSDEDNEDSDGVDEEAEERMERRAKPKSGTGLSQSVVFTNAKNNNASGDEDTEQALAEFDFLDSNKSDVIGEVTRSKEEWSELNGEGVKNMKDRNKEERPNKDKKAMQRPNRASLQAMLANLSNDDDQTSAQSPAANLRKANGSVKILGNKLSLGDDSSPLGLGELAAITINNEADCGSGYDVSQSKEDFRKVWTAKYTLRSHFDGVRAVAFHPTEPVVMTASEDSTLRLWNLTKILPTKNAASFDVEPVYILRAHQGPVLCLAIDPSGETCYSGGSDATIRRWSIPNSNVDPYDSFDSSMLQDTLAVHTDAVWGLAMHAIKSHLLSCSADGTVRLWSAGKKSSLLNTFRAEQENGVPTSIDFVHCDPNHMVAGYTSSHVYLFDIEAGKQLVNLECPVDLGLNSQINKVVSHPTLPITITAHEDRHIRCFDNNTGKVIHSMVAHQDAVTCLAVDPNGLYLLSGSHDCSLRLWNLDSKLCVQEVTSHRRKFAESIHDVAFHPSKPYIASAGADALAKVFI